MRGLNVKISGDFGGLNFDFNHRFLDYGITALFGPIGSGKSTIVNVIGGFNKELNATILLNKNIIQDENHLSPRLRPISIMFQENRLIETLTVYENLEFAEEKSRNKLCISQSIDKDKIINDLNLEEKLLKYPKSLSVGEKQLVSLARTLLISSEFIILDEPTSSLDLRLKKKILSFLKNFNKKYKKPILLISHSIEEISQISDEILLINKGKLVTSGKVHAVMIRKEFKNFFGKFESGAILEGKVLSKETKYNITRIKIEDEELILPGNFKKRGDLIKVRVRARDVLVSKKTFNLNFFENTFVGKVDEIIAEKETAFAEVLIKIGKNKKHQFLRARITRYQLKKMNLKISEKIFIHIKAVSFDRQAII